MLNDFSLSEKETYLLDYPGIITYERWKLSNSQNKTTTQFVLYCENIRNNYPVIKAFALEFIGDDLIQTHFYLRDSGQIEGPDGESNFDLWIYTN